MNDRKTACPGVSLGRRMRVASVPAPATERRDDDVLESVCDGFYCKVLPRVGACAAGMLVPPAVVVDQLTGGGRKPDRVVWFHHDTGARRPLTIGPTGFRRELPTVARVRRTCS